MSNEDRNDIFGIVGLVLLGVGILLNEVRIALLGNMFVFSVYLDQNYVKKVTKNELFRM